MANPDKIKIMGGFTFENMHKPFNTANASGNTVFDELIDAMDNLPINDPRAYGHAFNQLAAPTASNIRGIYGEAVTFRRLKAENLSSGSTLKASAPKLRIGRNVNYTIDGKEFNNKQGVDIESDLEPEELVSRSLQTETASGRPLFVEVKNYTSRYSPFALKKQTIKHFRANIKSQITRNAEGKSIWGTEKPHLHYEWMGESFVNADNSIKTSLFERRKQTVIDTCKKMIKEPPLNSVKLAFDCLTDITFNVVENLIAPLTAKVN